MGKSRYDKDIFFKSNTIYELKDNYSLNLFAKLNESLLINQNILIMDTNNKLYLNGDSYHRYQFDSSNKIPEKFLNKDENYLNPNNTSHSDFIHQNYPRTRSQYNSSSSSFLSSSSTPNSNYFNQATNFVDINDEIDNEINNFDNYDNDNESINEDELDDIFDPNYTIPPSNREYKAYLNIDEDCSIDLLKIFDLLFTNDIISEIVNQANSKRFGISTYGSQEDERRKRLKIENKYYTNNTIILYFSALIFSFSEFVQNDFSIIL